MMSRYLLDYKVTQVRCLFRQALGLLVSAIGTLQNAGKRPPGPPAACNNSLLLWCDFKLDHLDTASKISFFTSPDS